MAGTACKIIINNLTASINQSLERVLMLGWVREKLGPAKADEMIQELADLDIDHYQITYRTRSDINILGGRGMAWIINELVDVGVFTDEVWLILKRPE